MLPITLTYIVRPSVYHSLNLKVAQSKNCPFGTIEPKNAQDASHNIDIQRGMLARSQYPEGPCDRPPRHRFFLVSLCL